MTPNKHSKLYQLTLLLMLPTLSLPLSKDLNQPCFIDSDQAVYYKKAHRALFTGHVIATQGTSKMTANKAILYLDKENKKILQLIGFGAPATYTTLTQKKERLHSKADIIKYYPEKALVILSKHAKVTRLGDSVSGDLIHFDITKEQITTNGRKKANSRTMIIINPENVR